MMPRSPMPTALAPVNEMEHMSGVAIIDHAGPDPGAAHDYAHTWWIRDRLDRAQGNHANHVLWFGPAPLIGVQWPTEALLAMDRWLSAVQRDHSSGSRARKIADDRPADVHDRCTADVCKQWFATRYGTPRSVAGGDELNDVLKCQRKPLRRAELPGHVHRCRVGAAAEGVPVGGLRLVQARRRPGPQRRHG